MDVLSVKQSRSMSGVSSAHECKFSHISDVVALALFPFLESNVASRFSIA